jgi:hypothetical protein
VRSQFAFYKSFFDVYQDLNDKQKIEFMNTLLDVQFLKVRIESVSFKDVILKHIWNAQRHSLEKSINGYLESQKNTKVKNPFLGCYDNAFLPLQIPSEGNHKEEEEKEEEKGKGKDKATRIENLSADKKSELSAYMLEYVNDNDIDNIEMSKFVDYWKSVSGAKGLKSDWKATFRNWCRNDWVKKKEIMASKNQRREV